MSLAKALATSLALIFVTASFGCARSERRPVIEPRPAAGAQEGKQPPGTSPGRGEDDEQQQGQQSPGDGEIVLGEQPSPDPATPSPPPTPGGPAPTVVKFRDGTTLSNPWVGGVDLHVGGVTLAP